MNRALLREYSTELHVTVDGETRAYPQGTPYRTIAADFQARTPWDILLVNRDGKLCELHKVLDRDCTLKMVTAQDKPGIQTYERSAVFSPGGQRGRGRVYLRAAGDRGEHVRGYGADGSGRAGRTSSHGADCCFVCHCLSV